MAALGIFCLRRISRAGGRDCRGELVQIGRNT